jgi:hypothetical protein
MKIFKSFLLITVGLFGIILGIFLVGMVGAAIVGLAVGSFKSLQAQGGNWFEALGIALVFSIIVGGIVLYVGQSPQLIRKGLKLFKEWVKNEKRDSTSNLENSTEKRVRENT